MRTVVTGMEAKGKRGVVEALPKARKTQERGLLRQEQILDAARTTLLQQGVHGLVLREVALNLGITHGNLQYYFTSKDDLIVAVFERELWKYTSALRSAVKKSTSRRETLEAVIDAAIEELRTESTALWRMLISLSSQNATLGALLRKLNSGYDAALADELSRIAPDLTAKRRMQVTQVIRMMIDGLSIQMSYDVISNAELKNLRSVMTDAVENMLEH